MNDRETSPEERKNKHVLRFGMFAVVIIAFAGLVVFGEGDAAHRLLDVGLGFAGGGATALGLRR